MENRLFNISYLKMLEGFEKRLYQQGKKKNNIDEKVSQVKEYMLFLEERFKSAEVLVQRNVDAFFLMLHSRPNKKKAGGLNESYINKYRDAVLRFAEYITEKEIGESHIKIKSLSPKQKKIQVLTEKEVRDLFDACDHTLRGTTDKFILAMLFGCGLRKNELHTLEMSEVDLSKGLVYLSNTKTRNERDVVMTKSVMQMVEEYFYSARNIMLEENSDETHCLVTDKGYRMSIHTIPYRLKALARKIHLQKPMYAHLLRHTIGTILHHKGFSIEEVAQFLGHKDPNATMIYTHLKHQL